MQQTSRVHYMADDIVYEGWIDEGFSALAVYLAKHYAFSDYYQKRMSRIVTATYYARKGLT